MFKIVFEQKNGAGESIIVFKKGSHFVVNAVYQVKAVFKTSCRVRTILQSKSSLCQL